MRRVVWLAAGVLGTRAVGAQAPEDSVGRVFPLIDIGVARSFPATLTSRSVTGQTSAGAEHESVRLRLDGQWGIVGEARVPIGAAKVWGIDLYGARFRGAGRVSAGYQLAPGTPRDSLTSPTRDSLDRRLTGVTSWRASLGVVRALRLPARLTGALLVGGTYGRVTSPTTTCVTPPATAPGSVSCPTLDLTTPGVTLGADLFTPSWHGVRLRFALKDDVLRVDEAEMRRSLHWSRFNTARLGEGGKRWAFVPSATAGVEFRIPLS
jgi:hypothetical protein